MNLDLALAQGSQILVVILFILTMMLRSSKSIPNWSIQWIVLVIALPLSYLQSRAINIDVIMNAFMATGICIFGENAIFRKGTEKTKEECDILKMVDLCKEEVIENIGINEVSSIDEKDLKDIVQKVIKEVKTR